MSSWFGGGSSGSSSSSSSSTPSSFDSFSSSTPPPPPPPPSYSPNYGSGSSQLSSSQLNAAALEQALMQEQERAAISAAISKLTAICFEKCVGYPDTKLSNSETACIMNTAGRYLDTSMFVMGRLMRQTGGGQGEGH